MRSELVSVTGSNPPNQQDQPASPELLPQLGAKEALRLLFALV